jgi:uncharacterized protein YuzE
MRRHPIKFEYDKATDAAYLTLSRSKIRESEEVQPGLIVDFDADDRVVGVEILRFAERFAQPAKAKRKLAG